MFNNINTGSATPMIACDTDYSARFKRNQKDDMKIAIDALFEFRAKLEQLHPNCEVLISKMLYEKERY